MRRRPGRAHRRGVLGDIPSVRARTFGRVIAESAQPRHCREIRIISRGSGTERPSDPGRTNRARVSFPAPCFLPQELVANWHLLTPVATEKILDFARARADTPGRISALPLLPQQRLPTPVDNHGAAHCPPALNCAASIMGHLRTMQPPTQFHRARRPSRRRVSGRNAIPRRI